MNPGRLFLIGLGPGRREHLTLRAAQLLEEVDTVFGYAPYLDLVEAWFPSATRCSVRGTLGQERGRAREAIDAARGGARAAIVSSGDATVYGTGGPLFEVLAELGWDDACPDPVVEVVPGITAALAANAVLGAPLADDFALVSLSDVLAPWELIETRLEGAGRGDFVIALYNPASHRRRESLARAARILLRTRVPDTPVGLVWNALRDGDSAEIVTLADLPAASVRADMQTLVVVGNSRTARLGGHLASRRVPSA